jgi:hypothetical protein
MSELPNGWQEVNLVDYLESLIYKQLKSCKKITIS